MVVSSSIGVKYPITITNPKYLQANKKIKRPILYSINKQNPNKINNHAPKKVDLFGSRRPNTSEFSFRIAKRGNEFEENRGIVDEVGKKNGNVFNQQMCLLCGLGYWVQGLRCFPWLALNYHMAYNMNLNPSVLQLMQHFGNLPMVAKPLYGILSDVISIGDAHRIPYILIGVVLQLFSWGPLALFSMVGNALPMLIVSILVSNLGASITEVATDALVAEFGLRHRREGLQSYAFMVSAVGGVLGNLIGGCFLSKTLPKTMFLTFSVLLSLQLVVSSTIGEDTLGLMPRLDCNLVSKSIWDRIHKHLSGLKKALSDDSISRPLTWIVASIALVPDLSGCIFCYQTQCLHLNPSVIGMSRVIGQLMLLFMTALYERYWKELPTRKLITAVQFLYATSFLLDFALAKQMNLKLGIPNEVFVCCFSGLAETLAQFKILPFTILLATLCPRGCEGSLTSFLSATLCLSSIISGFIGTALASAVGITACDYSSLSVGILMQLVAALLPLAWIDYVPTSKPMFMKERMKGLSKQTCKNRRIGRVVLGSIFVYGRERESETQG